MFECAFSGLIYIYAAAIVTKPDATLFVFVDRPDARSRRSGFIGYSHGKAGPFEFSWIILANAMQLSSRPHCSFAIAEQCPDIFVRHRAACISAARCKRSLCPSVTIQHHYPPFTRTHPYRGIFRHRHRPDDLPGQKNFWRAALTRIGKCRNLLPRTNPYSAEIGRLYRHEREHEISRSCDTRLIHGFRFEFLTAHTKMIRTS